MPDLRGKEEPAVSQHTPFGNGEEGRGRTYGALVVLSESGIHRRHPLLDLRRVLRRDVGRVSVVGTLFTKIRESAQFRRKHKGRKGRRGKTHESDDDGALAVVDDLVPRSRHEVHALLVAESRPGSGAEVGLVEDRVLSTTEGKGQFESQRWRLRYEEAGDARSCGRS